MGPKTLFELINGVSSSKIQYTQKISPQISLILGLFLVYFWVISMLFLVYFCNAISALFSLYFSVLLWTVVTSMQSENRHGIPPPPHTPPRSRDIWFHACRGLDGAGSGSGMQDLCFNYCSPEGLKPLNEKLKKLHPPNHRAHKAQGL